MGKVCGGSVGVEKAGENHGSGKGKRMEEVGGRDPRREGEVAQGSGGGGGQWWRRRWRLGDGGARR